VSDIIVSLPGTSVKRRARQLWGECKGIERVVGGELRRRGQQDVLAIFLLERV
jgi:hypothetical protein